MGKIGIISDTHIGPDMQGIDPSSPEALEILEAKDFFPHKMGRLSSEQAFSLYKTGYQSASDAFGVVLDSIQQARCQTLIHLGDVTGGYKERGTTLEIKARVEKIVDQMRLKAGRLFFALGNHDLGYSGGPESQENAGLNPQAVVLSREVFGDLYWHFHQGNVAMMGVCSSLLEDVGDSREMLQLQKDQREFIGDLLASQSHRYNPWALYAHSPDAAKGLVKEIGPHVDRLQRFVFGDFHHPSIGALWLWAKRLAALGSSEEKGITRKALRKAILCPAASPFWCEGYYYMTAEVQKDDFTIQRHQALRPPQAIRTPFESPLYCALSMRPSLKFLWRKRLKSGES